MADEPIKRLRYFTGQFLEAGDFATEQSYHTNLRRHGNRTLYRSGILDDGFSVTYLSNERKLQISPGIGVDAQGRELVIVTPLTENPPPPGTHFVTLTYQEVETDLQSQTGADAVSEKTRFDETPKVKFFPDGTNIDTGTFIVITKVTVDNAGAITEIDPLVRQYADGRFPSSLTVGQGGNGVLNTRHIDGKDGRSDNKDDLFLNWTTGKSVYLGFGAGTQSSLFVSGNIGIGTNDPKAKLEIVGAAAIHDGNGYASRNGRMTGGSLTIGSTQQSYGGGSNWNANTAGLLLETLANTEIAVHDSGHRLASLMYYEGDAENRITIGRNMGSGVIGRLVLNGNVGIGTTEPRATFDVNGSTLLGYETTLTQIGLPAADCGAPLKSGFYQNGGVKIAGDVPDPSHGWTHLIVARHSNTGNNHQLQIASSYWSNDKLYFRKIAAPGTSNPPWNELATRGTNEFVGGQTIKGSMTVQGKLQVSEGGILNGMAIGVDPSPVPGAGDITFPYPYETIGTTDPRFNLRLHSNNSIAFHTGNAQGPKATINGDGHMVINGNIGTSSQSPTDGLPNGWGGGVHTWDLVAEGSVWAAQYVYCQDAQIKKRDLAENYISESALEPGDVVCLDPKEDRIVKSERANDGLLLGVISTSPGLLLGAEHSEDDQCTAQERLYPVALSGRVPCKVTDENGSISRGDFLTSSLTPGCAMKAAPVIVGGVEIYAPGTIIGKALEPFTVGTGVIEVFVTLK